MRRSLLVLAALAGLVAFLALSAALARTFGAANAEREVVVTLIAFQAAGDLRKLIAAIEGCADSGACRARMGRNVARLRSDDEARIVRIDPPSLLTSGPRTGVARVAWTSGERQPIVQCVRLRRAGTLLGGFRIEVLALSDPIPAEEGCSGETD